MQLIEGIALSKLCDYSFGDQSGKWGNIHTSFMKSPSLTNTEFVSKLFEVKKSRNYMTLFIDNIRLYKRHIVGVKNSDRSYVEGLMEESNLLHLCSQFPDMNFIIFTNLEDTPIDEYIFDCIPENVLCVSAVNAIANGGKVIPAPYGVQRRMSPQDNKIEILTYYINNRVSDPCNLLYVSHNENTNKERRGIKELFFNKIWAKVDVEMVNYLVFLQNLNDSKFMICPVGNAIDCHRNWEVIYMRRVPVMKRHPYLEKLYENYPVLFVDNYGEVTQELLLSKEHFFQEAQEIKIEKWMLPNYYNDVVNSVIKK